MNKTQDTLKNAIFKDNIPQGTNLNKDSIKVYYLEVDVNGNVTRGAEAEPTDYNIISSDGSKLRLLLKILSIKHIKSNMPQKLLMKILKVSEITLR